MTFLKPALVLALALLAAGCGKNAAEEAEAASSTATVAEAPVPTPTVAPEAVEPATPPTPVPGTDAAIIEDHATPIAAAPGFDIDAFAGRYAEGSTTLEIRADGSFILTADGSAIDGTWTLEPGGKQVTLDPNSKGDTDRKLQIVPGDRVRIVGGATLKRIADAG